MAESALGFQVAPVQVGDYVEIIGRQQGKVIEITHNFGFPAYLIKLTNGEMVTEARYRFDIIPSPSPADDICMPGTSKSNATYLSTQHTTQKSRFACVDQTTINIDDYIKDKENWNTAKNTMSDMNTLREFLNSSNEERPIECIPPVELCNILCNFFVVLRKKNGENYETNSIKCIYSSIERYLKEKRYGYSITCDGEFSTLQMVVKSKLKELKCDGKGNLSRRSDALTDSDIEQLFATGQLGDQNPESLLRTVWFYNTIQFGMRGVTEHRDMHWGDVHLITDASGCEYLQYNERCTKTRTGVNITDSRSIIPKAWANPTNKYRCPVYYYKMYRSLRPATYCHNDAPFYIATNTNLGKSSKWFKCQPVGVNKLSKIMSSMAMNAGLNKPNESDTGKTDMESSTTRKLTNHSARKYLVQKLNDSGVPPTQIMQISGHKNIQSINRYSTLNLSQQKQISSVLINKIPTAIHTDGTQAESNTHELSVTSTCTQLSQSVQNVSFTRPRSVNIRPSSNDNFQLSSLFSGPIHGGSFTINIIKEQSPKPKRGRE